MLLFDGMELNSLLTYINVRCVDAYLVMSIMILLLLGIAAGDGTVREDEGGTKRSRDSESVVAKQQQNKGSVFDALIPTFDIKTSGRLY